MKYFVNIIFLSLLINLISGCTPYIKKVKHYDVPFERPGYTILPPQGENWHYTEQGEIGSYILAFIKRYKSMTHSTVASITETHQSSSFKDSDEFLSFMTKIAQMALDPRRYNILDEQISLDSKFGTYCVRYYYKAEDHAKQPGYVPFLIMENYVYYFLHPDNQQLMITVMYSERGNDQEIDTAFKTSAIKFADGLIIKEIE